MAARPAWHTRARIGTTRVRPTSQNIAQMLAQMFNCLHTMYSRDPWYQVQTIPELRCEDKKNWGAAGAATGCPILIVNTAHRQRARFGSVSHLSQNTLGSRRHTASHGFKQAQHLRGRRHEVGKHFVPVPFVPTGAATAQS